MSFRLRGRGSLATRAVTVALALVAAGCGQSTVTPTPFETSVPIAPTPWANGTVGQYGLRIDPTLLQRLPIAVAGVQLVEDTDSEQAEMDDSTLTDIDRMAAAKYGDILGDSDWLQVWVVHFKADHQTPDDYSQWIDDYAAGACSQVTGTPEEGQATINSWTVDITTCGGVTAYSLALGDGEYVSMLGMGSKNLGKLLIQNLF